MNVNSAGGDGSQVPSSSPSASASTRKTILLINGPNLNLLGYREPGIYGKTTLAEIEGHLSSLAAKHCVTLQTFQSNHEGEIVDRIHAAFLPPSAPAMPPAYRHQSNKTLATVTASSLVSDPTDIRTTPTPNKPDAIIINPGALTHTSVAVRDALLGTAIPFLELHISNVHAREDFRRHSYLSDKAVAVVAGMGAWGYVAALEFWVRRWNGQELGPAV